MKTTSVRFNRADLIDAGWEIEELADTLVVGEKYDDTHVDLPCIAVFTPCGPHLIFNWSDNERHSHTRVEVMLTMFDNVREVH